MPEENNASENISTENQPIEEKPKPKDSFGFKIAFVSIAFTIVLAVLLAGLSGALGLQKNLRTQVMPAPPATNSGQQCSDDISVTLDGDVVFPEPPLNFLGESGIGGSEQDAINNLISNVKTVLENQKPDLSTMAHEQVETECTSRNDGFECKVDNPSGYNESFEVICEYTEPSTDDFESLPGPPRTEKFEKADNSGQPFNPPQYFWIASATSCQLKLVAEIDCISNEDLNLDIVLTCPDPNVQVQTNEFTGSAHEVAFNGNQGFAGKELAKKAASKVAQMNLYTEAYNASRADGDPDNDLPDVNPDNFNWWNTAKSLMRKYRESEMKKAINCPDSCALTYNPTSCSLIQTVNTSDAEFTDGYGWFGEANITLQIECSPICEVPNGSVSPAPNDFTLRVEPRVKDWSDTSTDNYVWTTTSVGGASITGTGEASNIDCPNPKHVIDNACGAQVSEGNEVTITAVESGADFIYWDGLECPGVTATNKPNTKSLTFDMPNNDIVCVAKFDKLPIETPAPEEPDPPINSGGSIPPGF